MVSTLAHVETCRLACEEQAGLLAEDGQGLPAGQSQTRISARTNGDHDASGVSNRTDRKVSQYIAVYCDTHMNGPTSVNHFGSSPGLGQDFC